MGTAQTFAEALREALEVLGGVRSKAEIGAWIDAHYPGRWKTLTFVGHLYGCSVNNPKGIQHHPGFSRFLYAHGNSRYELYDAAKHGHYNEQGYPSGDDDQLAQTESAQNAFSDESENGGSPSFAYEAHLRDYLARNLTILEPGLSLWVPDSEMQSVEYDIEGRRIDILARDTDGIPVIIELKVSRGHEKTVGQCAYYRAKLKQVLGVLRIRVMIVAQDLSPELRLAATELSDCELFEYALTMTVSKQASASAATAAGR